MLFSDLVQANRFDRIRCHNTILRLSDIFVITTLVVACCVALPPEQSSYPIPRRPRVFVTHYRDETLTDYSVAVQFRWSSPVSVENFTLSSYNVLVSNTTNMWLSNESVADNQSEYGLEPAPKNMMLYFKVKACSTFICGQYTDLVMTNTSVENPPPKVLIIEPELAKVYLPDTKSLFPVVSGSIAALTLVTFDDTFYWISAVNGELYEETGNSLKILTTLRNEALNMVVDWIGRYLFWLERSNQCSYIQRYDLSRSTEPVTVTFVCDSINGTIHYIQVDPFHSAIYYTQSQSKESAVSLIKYRYNVQKAEVIMGLVDSSSRNCVCSQMTLFPIFTVDPRPNEVNNISIYVVDATKWEIWGLDKDGCYCYLIHNSSLVVESSLGFPPVSLTVDHNRLYWIGNQSQSILYSIDKYNWKDFLAESTISNSMSFILGYNVLPLPGRNCLILQSFNHSVSLFNATSSSFTLRIHMSTSPLQNCGDLSLPSVYYVVEYSENDSNESKVTQHFYDTEIIFLTQLKPYTFYNISIGASNYFASLWKSHSMSSPVLLQTKSGIPSSPRDVTVSVLTASTVSVQWHVPDEPHGRNLSEIIYAIHWAGSNLSYRSQSNGTIWVRNPGRGQFLTEAVQGLLDSQVYQFKVLAYDSELTGFSPSLMSSAKTFQKPGPVQLLAATTESLLLSWSSPADNSVTRFTVEYAEVNEHTDDLFWLKHLVDGQMIHISGPKIKRNVSISGLKSGQAYAARVEVIYRSEQPYTWPTANFSIFHTQSRRPESPGTPYFIKGTEDMRFTMHWSSPADQWSLPVDSYQLVCSLPDSEGNISEVYAGHDSFWHVNGLSDSTPYFCRARARNQFGWGSFSNWSAVFVYQFPSPSQEAESAMMMKLILIPLFVLLIVAFIVATLTYVLCKFRRKFRPLSGVASKANHPPYDDEFCVQSLAGEHSEKYYALNIVPALEEASCTLPNFCRDRVTLTKFICERKNGDLFEGLATGILGDGGGQMPVILRTINGGELSELDMEERMKEIAFMNRMRHKNIVTMLGVCLVGEPLLIIFESPDVGDFLTFLRGYQSTTQTISVLNLLNFCLDIVSGCQFFEERHLVHRDIRAKHCFVFCHSSTYLVKIGGFSLLKDICESKTCLELPSSEVLQSRWMAPEAITDNFFTSMSDAWAFGVVMWEVFTLGQVPYSDKTNETEILQFLKSEGRLNKPVDCPENIFSMMLSCWRSSPFRRPSFHYLADQLQKMHRHLNDDQTDTRISEKVNSGSTADSSTEDMNRVEPRN